MTLYTDYQANAAPVWLQRPTGRAWNEAHGLVKDVVVDAARVATKAGWPLATPADGLPFIGSERSLPRVPSDTDDTYRATLNDAFDLWEYGGTEAGVIAALVRRWPACAPNILTYWDNPSYFGSIDSQWAQWRLRVTMSTWGDPATWGSGVIWGDPSLTWGIAAPVGEVAELRDIIRTWNAGYAACVQCIVTTPDGDIEIQVQ